MRKVVAIRTTWHAPHNEHAVTLQRRNGLKHRRAPEATTFGQRRDRGPRFWRTVTVEVSDRQKDDLLRRGTRGTPYGPLHAKKIDHDASTWPSAGSGLFGHVGVGRITRSLPLTVGPTRPRPAAVRQP